MQPINTALIQEHWV